MQSSSVTSRVLALILVVLIAVPAWLVAAVAAPQLPDPGSVMGVNRDQQQQLGLQAAGEVYKQMPILPDSSPVTRYVQSLGKKLETVIPQQYSWPYQYHVVQESDINAFALPGGPIFVNVGTIMAADNEAELAGVMAHEMSHVYMQHSAKSMQKQGLVQGLAGILGSVLGGAIGGTAGALAQAGISIGGGLVSMKYSRSDEAQADAVGAIIMYKAGYSPIYMAQFFQKLEQEGASGPQFLSDHPNPGNRVTAVQKQIQGWPGKKYLNDTSQFAQVRQQAGTVKAYTAEQIGQMAKSGQIQNTGVPAGVATATGGQAAPSGQTAPGGQATSQGPMSAATPQQVKPSSSFEQYEGGGFSIERPSNWQVIPDQQSGGVTIAPAAGVSQGSVAYGAILSGFQPQGAANLADGTQQLISTITQSNPGMRQVGSPQNIRVNGVAGKSVDLLASSPIQGQDGKPLQERDWLVSLTGPNGGIVFVVFVAPDRDFPQLRPTFERMLRTLHLGQQ